MNAWPNVLIKTAGSTIIIRKIVKCEWSDTLGKIVERVDWNISHKVAEKVINYLIKNRKLIIVIAFFSLSNLPTDSNILSGMPMKQLLQLKWPRSGT